MPSRPRSVLIVTDAWYPQVNGVVRTVDKTSEQLRALDIAVHLITPEGFRTIPMPGYHEIGLSLTMSGPVVRRIEALAPEAIHVATEGPLGLIVRNYCVRNGLPFTTAYHTQFPDYLRARIPMPLKASYGIVKWFHKPATACLVGTPYPGPVFLYVGRVAVEKNIEAFLRLDLPGTKLVVGDGPSLKALRGAFPNVVFLGARHGEELAQLFASADVFVFPSRTDTFGLVLLEALASGTPVAAFPVTGPIDVIGTAPVGVLDTDLRAAALKALDVPRDPCRTYAEAYSWTASAEQFLSHVTLLGAR